MKLPKLIFLSKKFNLTFALSDQFSHDAAGGVADLRPLIFIPIVSRCGSALAVLCLKPIGHSEYARMAGQNPQRATVLVLWLLSTAACALWLGRPAVALLIETAAYALSMTWVYRALQGVSGDLAGFALTVSECAALIALTGLGG